MTNFLAKKKVILPKSRGFLRETFDCELLYFSSVWFYMRNNVLFVICQPVLSSHLHAYKVECIPLKPEPAFTGTSPRPFFRFYN